MPNLKVLDAYNSTKSGLNIIILGLFERSRRTYFILEFLDYYIIRLVHSNAVMFDFPRSRGQEL